MPDYADRYDILPDFDRARPSLSDEEVAQLQDLLAAFPTQTSDFPQITASVNDLPVPLGALVLRIPSDAGGPYDITGFAGVLGTRQLFVHNLGSSSFTLLSESLNSLAEHRIRTGSVGAVVPANKTAHLVYDNIGKRWLVIAVTP